MNEASTIEARRRGTSFLKTCFNTTSALLGIGLIAVPYALAQTGWFGLSLLLGMAVITCYTGFLIMRCIDSNSSIKTYPDILLHTFGKTGNLILSTLMYLELFLASTGFLILEGDNMNKLFPNATIELAGQYQIRGKMLFTLVAGIIVLPSMWVRDLTWLSYISLTSVFSSIVIVCSVFWVGISEEIGLSSEGELLNLIGIPTTVSIYAFCYGAHAVFPTLYSSMKDKRQFSKVLFISFGFTTTCYISMAIIGYLLFGKTVSSQVTLNLPKNKLSSKIALYTTLVGPIAKYALIATPIALAMEARLPIPYNNNKFICMFIRTMLLVSSLILALVFPYFGILIAFIGALLEVTFNILVPCICYLKISKSQQKLGFETIIVIAIIVLAISIEVLGTYASIKDVLKHVI